MEKNNIYCIDCIEGFKKISNETIDLILTDPPYGLNKIGIKNDEDLSLFYKILPECYRVLKKDSFFIVFFSIKYLDKIFKKNPFTYYWQIILCCKDSKVKSKIGNTNFMYVVIFKKGNPKIKNRNTDLFLDSNSKMIEPYEGYINHPTPKPTIFIKKLIKMFSNENDLILDPFMGSGSTAISSKELNRNYLGFEIEEKYINLSLKRLKKRFFKYN